MDAAFLLLGPVLFGVWVGIQLDKKFSHGFPLWTLICSLLGFLTGMWSVYKRYIRG